MNHRICLVIVFLGILITTPSAARERNKDKRAAEVSVTSVYDNYQVNPECKTAWGFGSVIRTAEHVLLFDCGGDSKALLSNLAEMGIDPKSITHVFLSHIHRDHVGGLEGFLEAGGDNVTVYVPASFPRSIHKMIIAKGGTCVPCHKPDHINGAWYTTGELLGPPWEQSLIITSQRGLVVITGCAHPGIVHIVKRAQRMFPDEKVFLVLGGFHLLGASDSQLRRIVQDLKRLGVEKVAPSHCSGDRCRELFQSIYQKDYIEYGVGQTVNILELQ